MAKFTAGDKVKVLSNEGGSVNQVGSVGIITEVCEQDSDCRVLVKGQSDSNMVNWHHFDDLQLVLQ